MLQVVAQIPRTMAPDKTMVMAVFAGFVGFARVPRADRRFAFRIFWVSRVRVDMMISEMVERLMDEVSVQRAPKSANSVEVHPGSAGGIEFRYPAGILGRAGKCRPTARPARSVGLWLRPGFRPWPADWRRVLAVPLDGRHWARVGCRPVGQPG